LEQVEETDRQIVQLMDDVPGSEIDERGLTFGRPRSHKQAIMASQFRNQAGQLVVYFHAEDAKAGYEVLCR
jgi:hypothetical protein